MKKVFYCLIAATFLMTGCAPSHYDWGNYDQKLYNHYQNPAQYDQYIDDLKNIITQRETADRVPPGIFAEYGYAMYEKGNFPESIEYFKKEQSKWPESNVLMTKMIKIAQNRVAQGENIKNELPTAVSQAQEVLR